MAVVVKWGKGNIIQHFQHFNISSPSYRQYTAVIWNFIPSFAMFTSLACVNYKLVYVQVYIMRVIHVLPTSHNPPLWKRRIQMYIRWTLHGRIQIFCFVLFCFWGVGVKIILGLEPLVGTRNRIRVSDDFYTKDIYRRWVGGCSLLSPSPPIRHWTHINTCINSTNLFLWRNGRSSAHKCRSSTAPHTEALSKCQTRLMLPILQDFSADGLPSIYITSASPTGLLTSWRPVGEAEV